MFVTSGSGVNNMLGNINSLKLPDPWQHQAVNLLRDGTDVVVSAPTGAGKTYIFELLHQGRHLQGQAIYTVPTRALANDKYAEWKDAKWNVGIATGDIAENVDAPVVVATLETQLERLVRGEGPALLVIDEYQMISDHARGANYEAAIALAPANTRLLLLSGSVANPEDVVAWMRSLNRKAEVVLTKDRPVPLEEAPIEALPQRQKQFENYWPRFAAAVMLAPLRSGPQPTRTQNASFIPLLDAQGVAESAAFRRLSNVRPLEALAEPQVKQPTSSRPRRD